MSTSVPKPGEPVRGSKTGKPIMALFDLLGRSWALGVIWQLSDGEATFRVLQQRCESVSPTVLNRRIKELRESGFVEKGEGGYALTSMGEDLLTRLRPMAEFSEKWADHERS